MIRELSALAGVEQKPVLDYCLSNLAVGKNYPESSLKSIFLGPGLISRESYCVGLAWSPIICISPPAPGDAEAAALLTTLSEALP